jgi:hypothetical protein
MVNKRDVEVFIVCLSCHFDVGLFHVIGHGGTPLAVLNDTVPVPYFLLFLCFRKVTYEIFSELDKTKAEPPIFTEALRRPKMRQGGPGARLTIGWCGDTSQTYL